MFAVTNIRSPDSVSMYNERSVDMLSATQTPTCEAIDKSAHLSHNSSARKNVESLNVQSYQLSPLSHETDDDKGGRKHNRDPQSKQESYRQARKQGTQCENEYGSHRNIDRDSDSDNLQVASIKRRARAYSVDRDLDKDFLKYKNPTVSKCNMYHIVGHGSMVSLRQLDDLYGDDETFAAVDVSSCRRKSIPISIANLTVVDDVQGEKKKKLKRRKERQRQKRLNASLPSLRGIDVDKSDIQSQSARSSPHDPEDPRYSQKNNKPSSTCRKHGDRERPQSARRPTSGCYDGIPRSSKRTWELDGEVIPPHHEVTSSVRRQSNSMSNVLYDDQKRASGHENFFPNETHQPTKRNRQKDRRASDSSRRSLRDRDFESDGIDDFEHYNNGRDPLKYQGGSFKRSVSHDNQQPGFEEYVKHSKRKTKAKHSENLLRRSGSKRMLMRNSSQESFSSGIGPDDQYPILQRRGSTASLIKVKPKPSGGSLKNDGKLPVPENKTLPKTKTPPLSDTPPRTITPTKGIRLERWHSNSGHLAVDF